MSVYIKGITPPKRCSDCQFLEGDYMDGLCHAANKWLDDDEHWTWYVYPEGDADFSKPCNCPLIPVPDHGRLIDADALLCKYYNGSEDGKHINYAAVITPITVGNVPTIIEAEEGE